jgi:hypothetical protein
MKDAYQYPTDYFLQEGKENLTRCLNATFKAAVAHSVEKVVIFTSAGQGVKIALEDYCVQDQFAAIKVIGVTFPSQTHFSVGDPSEHSIPPDLMEFFANRNVPIVRAHLPFEHIRPHHEGHGILGHDFSLIDNALRIFCGSMSLCVQAVLMASDAGNVAFGEHVVAMTSDTSILVRAAGTSRFLTDLIVREIICKPVLLTIGKSEQVEAGTANVIEDGETFRELQAPDE